MQLDCGLGGDCFILRFLFFPTWENFVYAPEATLAAWGLVFLCTAAIYFWWRAMPKNEWEERVFAAEWAHVCASVRYVVKGGKRPVYRRPLRLQFKSLPSARLVRRGRAVQDRVNAER